MPINDIDKSLFVVRKSTENLLQTAGEILSQQVSTYQTGIGGLVPFPSDANRTKLCQSLEIFDQTCDEFYDVITNAIDATKKQLELVEKKNFDRLEYFKQENTQAINSKLSLDEHIEMDVANRMRNLNRIRSLFQDMKDDINSDISG